MNNQLSKFESKDFVKFANDIIKAADTAKVAALNLRKAYIFKSENPKVKALRTIVFNDAYVYNLKIIPFTETSITSIKGFCDSISKDYNKFAEELEFIIEKAEKGESICKITCGFHSEIFVQFKKIQDHVTKLEAKQDLTDELKRKFELMSLIFPTHGNTNEDEQAYQKVIEPLTNSIKNYVEHLKEISGFFNNLLQELRTLNENVGEANAGNTEKRNRFYHGLICENAESIAKSCKYYIELKPDIVSDFSCVEETPCINYVNGWILRVVKEIKMENDFNVLKIKYKWVKEICE